MYSQYKDVECAIPVECNNRGQLQTERNPLNEGDATLTLSCIAQCAVTEAFNPQQSIEEENAGGFPRSGCTYIPAVCRALNDCSQRVMTGTPCPDNNDD